MSETGPEASSSPLIVDGSPDAVGLLGFLNAPTTTHAVLDDDVPLDRRAADNLIGHRDGPDGVAGTRDDDLFDDIAEVDAVFWVGPSTMDRLLAHARSLGWVPEGGDLLGTYDGVPFTVDEAAAVLAFVNTASETMLDDEVGLDRRAVASILAETPVSSVQRLAELYYVGRTALERLKAHAGAPPSGRELGIISDLDKTIIPPHSGGLPAAPYPGAAALYTELELRDAGSPGDTHYVTARTAAATEGVAPWLAAHGLPAGPIEPGVSGVPWVARPEKVADITAIFEANPDQRFVLLGDSSHVDPDVMSDLLGSHPDRIAAALVHDVTGITEADLAPGILLYEDYAHAAALLLDLGLLDEAAARRTMQAAQAEGLAITDAEIELLLGA